MTETLCAFHTRVDGFTLDSLPHEGEFRTREPLREKVSPEGRLRPFYGNTMIYDLPDAAKVAISRMQVLLHHFCGGFLAEPLTPSTLHLTLHDLLNGPDEAPLREGLCRTGEAAQAILRDMQQEGQIPIHLVSTRAFNMVNGSVALGFAPETEADCAALMAQHARFQAVVKLDYPLTPHVTLAYYRPGTYGRDMVDTLGETLRRLAELPPVRVMLTADKLGYRQFSDMNHYF